MSDTNSIDPKYIYDHGFGPRTYHCMSCKSHKLIMIPQGGFSPPKYDCENCGKTCGAPNWTTLEVETSDEESENGVTVNGLLEFQQTTEETYASQFGRGKNKKLNIVCSGGYKVYNKGEVVLECMSAADAVKKFNSL